MSVGYTTVQWTAQKKKYDALLLGGVALYLAAFVGGGAALHPDATAETLLIRGLGSGALVLLHVILLTGPLARLDRRFLPLLYNRRHMGVTMFTLALAHGVFSIVQFHALGDMNPLLSLLVSNPRIDSVSQFPFQPLGLAALTVFFLMAATSHDYWLRNLTPPVWKTLHMGVYLAYGLVVMHVTLGVLQAETHPLLGGSLLVGLVLILSAHLTAAARERAVDARERRPLDQGEDAGFVEVCRVQQIPEDRAVVAVLGGERVAVFRYSGVISAISNVCRHQNGPLGEGKIIDGCVTCPWHGFQYQPDCGAAPPPFTEKVPTFRVRVRGDRVLVHPQPLPPGTRVEPAPIDGGALG
ncbi:MAG: ferric reductase-like transmembrane domain-containing protein [Alphaproteobacteria bacterium]|nr:ferric reductase-like transmembrane domain-containing protein [Alphaproteobacteria bacterium]